MCSSSPSHFTTHVEFNHLPQKLRSVQKISCNNDTGESEGDGEVASAKRWDCRNREHI